MQGERFNIMNRERLLKIIEDMTEVIKNFDKVLDVAKVYV